jgi:ethanolamine utilization protein EutN
MQPALVIGTARATAKHPSLVGQRMLVVQPIGVNDQYDGAPLLAVDQLGASPGDRVMMTSDGSLASKLMNSKTSPVRWVTMGIIDQ